MPEASSYQNKCFTSSLNNFELIIVFPIDLFITNCTTTVEIFQKFHMKYIFTFYPTNYCTRKGFGIHNKLVFWVCLGIHNKVVAWVGLGILHMALDTVLASVDILRCDARKWNDNCCYYHIANTNCDCSDELMHTCYYLREFYTIVCMMQWHHYWHKKS